MAMDPNFVAERLEREPLRLPIGVRATPTMQTSAMQQRSTEVSMVKTSPL